MKHLSEELMSSNRAAFLKCVHVEWADGVLDPTQSTGDDRSQDDARKLLIESGTKQYRPLSLCYKDAGLVSDRAVRAKDKLVNDGLVREWKKGWPRPGSGGHPCFLELTELGKRVLAGMGLKAYRAVGKGGFQHRVIQNGYLPKYFDDRGCRYELEYNVVGAKQIDFVYWDEYGRINAIEIAASGTAEHNAQAGVRCALIEGVHSVVVACISQSLVKGVKKALQGELLSVQKKITPKWVGEYWPWGPE